MILLGPPNSAHSSGLLPSKNELIPEFPSFLPSIPQDVMAPQDVPHAIVHPTTFPQDDPHVDVPQNVILAANSSSSSDVVLEETTINPQCVHVDAIVIISLEASAYFPKPAHSADVLVEAEVCSSNSNSDSDHHHSNPTFQSKGVRK